MRMSKLLLVCFAILTLAMGCSKSGEQTAETSDAPMAKTEAAPAAAAAVEEVTLAVTGMT